MSDFFKDMTPQPLAAKEFLSYWFDGVSDNSLVSIVRIHPMLPRVFSHTFTLEQIKGALESSGLDSLIYQNGTYYDLYFSVSTLNSLPEHHKRGGMKNVDLVPGVWIDFDVKSGAFESAEEIYEYILSMTIQPSAIVWTGSGGAHAYWKFEKPQSCEVVKTLALRWWSYIQSDVLKWAECLQRGGHIAIDKLCDPTRIMRLPGSIRWPKKAEEVPAPVVFGTTPTVHAISDLERVSEDAWTAYQDRLAKKRKQVESGKFEAMEALKSDNPWMELMQIALMEEWFNETYSWDSLLIPKGWTRLGEDEDGRVLWSRPGDGYRKSATTDWPESPHVMSLFSSSEETGLFELYESGIILSKYRVYIELFCDGSESTAVTLLKDEFFK